MRGDNEMRNYNIVATTETEKSKIVEVIRSVGAVLTAISGYGNGYYIQLNATTEQAERINSALEVVA